jgi:calpain-15
VLLLEKAWAKLHGSYERIESGYAEHVLRDLTGAATKVFSHDDQDLWENMWDAQEKEFLIAASAGATKASK